MAAKTSKSDFAKTMGAINTVVKKGAKEKTTYGVQPLPPGITDGIAELDVCEFGKVKEGAKNAGKWYFRAAGTVKAPAQFVGRKTSQLIGLYDQGTGEKKTTRDEQVLKMMNLMRQLGGEDFTEDCETADDLERLCDVLVEKRPKFKFSTSGGGTYFNEVTKKEQPGKIFENWHGTEGVDQDDEIPADAGTEETAEEEEEEEEAPPPKKPGKKAETEGKGGKPPKGPKVKAAEEEEPEEEEETEEESEEEETEEFDEAENDLPSLVIAANGKDGKARQAAQAKLEELALAAGASQKKIDNAADWQAVADLCGAGEEAEEETEEEEIIEEEVEEAVPEVGALYKYQETKGGKPLTDVKGKVKKPIEVEVIKVFSEKKLVYLKNNQTQKNILGKDGVKNLAVSWDALIPIED